MQHGFNAVLILGEVFLNSLPIFAYLMGYVGLWSSLYGIWAQLHYLRTGRFLYPVSYFAFLLCTRAALCLGHHCRQQLRQHRHCWCSGPTLANGWLAC